MNADQMASRAWKEKCELLEGENKVFKEELAVQMKENDRLFILAGRTIRARRWAERFAWVILIMALALAGVGVSNYRLHQEVFDQREAIDRAWKHSFERDLIMAEQSALLIGKHRAKHRRAKR